MGWLRHIMGRGCSDLCWFVEYIWYMSLQENWDVDGWCTRIWMNFGCVLMGAAGLILVELLSMVYESPSWLRCWNVYWNLYALLTNLNELLFHKVHFCYPGQGTWSRFESIVYGYATRCIRKLQPPSSMRFRVRLACRHMLVYNLVVTLSIGSVNDLRGITLESSKRLQ